MFNAQRDVESLYGVAHYTPEFDMLTKFIIFSNETFNIAWRQQSVTTVLRLHLSEAGHSIMVIIWVSI